MVRFPKTTVLLEVNRNFEKRSTVYLIPYPRRGCEKRIVLFLRSGECVQARVERLNYPIKPVVFLPVP